MSIWSNVKEDANQEFLENKWAPDVFKPLYWFGKSTGFWAFTYKVSINFHILTAIHLYQFMQCSCFLPPKSKRPFSYVSLTFVLLLKLMYLGSTWRNYNPKAFSTITQSFILNCSLWVLGQSSMVLGNWFISFDHIADLYLLNNSTLPLALAFMIENIISTNTLGSSWRSYLQSIAT